MSLEILLGLLFFAAGVVATWLITALYYRRALTTKQICWTSRTDELVGDKTGKLAEVLLVFETKMLADPRSDSIYIWNSGNTTISREDVAAADPCRLEYRNSNVLRVHEVRGTRLAIAPKVSKTGENTVTIDFAFLDPGDGIAFTVFYDTELPRYTNAFTLLGSIKGLNGGYKKVFYYDVHEPPRSFKNRVVASLSFLVLLGLAGLFALEAYQRQIPAISILSTLTMAIILLAGAVVAASLALSGMRRPGTLPSLLKSGRKGAKTE